MIKVGKFSYAHPILPKSKDQKDDSFFHHKNASVQYQESMDGDAERKSIVDVKFPALNAKYQRDFKLRNLKQSSLMSASARSKKSQSLLSKKRKTV